VNDAPFVHADSPFPPWFPFTACEIHGDRAGFRLGTGAVPRTLPSLPAGAIMSAWAMTSSQAFQPSMIFCHHVVAADELAPASVAFACFSAAGENH